MRSSAECKNDGIPFGENEKEAPASEKQKKRLSELIEKHKLVLDVEIQSMKDSKNPIYGVRDWGGFVLLH